MFFLFSAAALAVAYLIVGRLERLPALRFRRLSSRRDSTGGVKEGWG